MLKKLFGKSVRTFDKTKKMVTRNLPIPNLEDTGSFIRFTAKKNEEGYWMIAGEQKLSTVTTGLQMATEAYRKAICKHTSAAKEDLAGDMAFTFDSAFLILRDMEESLLNYAATEAGPEPDHHFMAAYRLANANMKTALDERFYRTQTEKGLILKPKSLPPAAAPDKGALPPAVN
jgi:hypothetical protein